MAMDIPQATATPPGGGAPPPPPPGAAGGVGAGGGGGGGGGGAVTDKYPSGTWSFGPISIEWSIKDGDEIDVSVSVLGFDIDTLTGTLKSGDAAVASRLSVLGIVSGSLELEAIWDQPAGQNGLWVRGQVSAAGWHSGELNHRIIPW